VTIVGLYNYICAALYTWRDILLGHIWRQWLCCHHSRIFILSEVHC